MISGALLAAIASSGGVSEDFQAILSTVVGSDTSSVTLSSSGSSAPWTEFQDLLLIASPRVTTSGTAGVMLCKLNNNASNYSTQNLHADGSTATATRSDEAGARIDCATRSSAHADQFGALVATFGDINSARYKAVMCIGAGLNNGVGEIGAPVSIWRDTTAVTSLVFVDAGGNNIATGSRFDLYGLRSS